MRRARNANMNGVLGLVALTFVLGVLAWQRLVPEEEYVLYRGQRLPPSAAGDHTCHFVNLPEVRCFDDWRELEADLRGNFPSAYAGYVRVQSITFPPEPAR